FFILLIVSGWKIFTKAGEPGWASIVPIYSFMVLARICGRGEIFGLVYMIPCIGPFIMPFDIAKAFGREQGFALGFLFFGPIFYPMWASGSSEYMGSGGPRRKRRRRVEEDDEEEEEEEEERPRRRRPSAEDERVQPPPKRRPPPPRDDEDEEEDRPPPRR